MPKLDPNIEAFYSPPPAATVCVCARRIALAHQAKAALIGDLRTAKESYASELTDLKVAKQARPGPAPH